MPIFTYAMLQLFVTGRMTKICSRTSHIMNVALKVFFPDHLFCFIDKRLVTSCLDNSSLVKCQRTEITASETTSVTDQAEFYLPDCRNTACFFIRRMIGAHVGIAVSSVHLSLCKRLRWRILNNIQVLTIRFCHSLSCKGIGIAILCIKTFCVV